MVVPQVNCIEMEIKDHLKESQFYLCVYILTFIPSVECSWSELTQLCAVSEEGIEEFYCLLDW